MTQEPITEKDIADLVARVADANAAFIRGEMGRYVTLIKHAADYTLMAPFGGAPTHGFDPSSERLAAMARFFTGGTAELEVVQTYASGDQGAEGAMAVLVVIERQRAKVGGLPEQDWSLRVTLVFRREGAEWRQVHRHADPLVKSISLHQAAALARG
jgi:ketosteroid isomerase-like protein